MKAPSRSRHVSLAVVVALVLAMGAFPIPATGRISAQAASSFTGGADQWPLYAANDHTPVAVHFTASGLATSTPYYVKVRFTVGTSPSGSTNRGFTWNPVTNTWVQERDDWTLFPTVVTDASGNIASSSGWAFAKFGDELRSGTYHVLISLSETGLASTYNASFAPTITVVDPRVDGSWVHNGIATAKAASKNARVTDVASTTVLALQKTEGQLVDDDANGITDDEDFGPAGNTGDFRMAVPPATAIGVNLNQTTWAPAAGFVSGAADVDLAIDNTPGADIVAPTAPGALSVESGDGAAELSWTASTDAGTLAGYFVYRWQPVIAGTQYSAHHARIATLAPSATSFDDSGLVNGETYLYEVRAFDSATNVGPRSEVGTATPAIAAPEIGVTPSEPDGSNDWYVTTPSVTLTSSGPGRTCEYSLDTSAGPWTSYTTPFEVPNGTNTVYYRETDGVTASVVQDLEIDVDTIAPSSSVSSPFNTVLVSRDNRFTVSWAGGDSESGVEGFDVDYKIGSSGAYVPLRTDTAATSTVVVGTLGRPYYFRARSRDQAGNVSAWTPDSLTMVPYDQTQATRSGNWRSIHRSQCYRGSALYSTSRSSSMTYRIGKGTLYLIATSGRAMGRVRIYANGHVIKTIDTYSSTTKYRKIYGIGTFSRYTVIKIVNLRTPGRSRVEIDGFAQRW